MKLTIRRTPEAAHPLTKRDYVPYVLRHAKLSKLRHGPLFSSQVASIQQQPSPLPKTKASTFTRCRLTTDNDSQWSSSAKILVEAFAVKEHRTVEIDLRASGGSALTDDIIDVPKERDEEAMTADIPVTYVPARNTIFLSYALAWAEVLEAKDIFIGVFALDYSGYPDCRPEFIAAFTKTANLALAATVDGGQPLRIHTPLIHLKKSEIIERVPPAWTTA